MLYGKRNISNICNQADTGTIYKPYNYGTQARDSGIIWGNAISNIGRYRFVIWDNPLINYAILGDM